jgi:hypothetical protein
MDKERRAKSRYPLQLNVSYQTMGVADQVDGVGRTVNVSSGGVLINSICTIGEGARVRVVFEWPSLLNGTIPLQLVTLGTVVRRHYSGLAVAFEGYQFRTTGRRANLTTMPDPRRSSGYSASDVVNLQMLAKSLP